MNSGPWPRRTNRNVPCGAHRSSTVDDTNLTFIRYRQKQELRRLPKTGFGQTQTGGIIRII